MCYVFSGTLECTQGTKTYDLSIYGYLLIPLTGIGLLFSTMDTFFYMTESCCGCSLIAGSNEGKQHYHHVVFEAILNAFQDSAVSLITLMSGYVVGFVSKEFIVSIVINCCVSIVYSIKNYVELKYGNDARTAVEDRCGGTTSCCTYIFCFQFWLAIATLFALIGLDTDHYFSDNRILVIDDYEYDDFWGYEYHDVEIDDCDITVFCDDSADSGYNDLPDDGTIIYCDNSNFEFSGSCTGAYIGLDSCETITCSATGYFCDGGSRSIEICYGQCVLN